MSQNMRICFRCSGQKKMYKVCNGYSLINSGGAHVDCPLCLGKGEIKTLDEVTEEVTKRSKKREEKASGQAEL